MLHGKLTDRKIWIRNPKSVKIRPICVIRVPFSLMKIILPLQTHIILYF